MGTDTSKRTGGREHAGRTRSARALRLEVGADARAWSCMAAREAARLARQVAAALARHRISPTRATAAIVLSSDARVKVLNSQWRGIDKPTNVLSFPAFQPPRGAARPRNVKRHAPAASGHLGDVIVAEETVVREAHDLGIAVQDHFRHLVLHGLLHLLGYDHDTDEEAEEMEALETRLLATLGVADPYVGTVAIPRPAPSARARRTGKRAR